MDYDHWGLRVEGEPDFDSHRCCTVKLEGARIWADAAIGLA